jgi:hypothetical protein
VRQVGAQVVRQHGLDEERVIDFVPGSDIDASSTRSRCGSATPSGGCASSRSPLWSSCPPTAPNSAKPTEPVSPRTCASSTCVVPNAATPSRPVHANGTTAGYAHAQGPPVVPQRTTTQDHLSKALPQGPRRQAAARRRRRASPHPRNPTALIHFICGSARRCLPLMSLSATT